MAKIQGSQKANTNTYSLLEDDVYDARITKVVFLGMQAQRPYMGKEKPDALQAQVTFELIGEVITQTNSEGETKDFPATISQIYNVPAGGCAMGKLVALLSAAVGAEETFEDTDDYESLLNQAVSVNVGSYESKKTGRKHNCINGVAALGKRTKEKLGEASSDIQFFCCYADSDDMKTGWTNLFPYVRKIVEKATDGQYIPAIKDSWPEKIDSPDTEETTTTEDEF